MACVMQGGRVTRVRRYLLPQGLKDGQRDVSHCASEYVYIYIYMYLKASPLLRAPLLCGGWNAASVQGCKAISCERFWKFSFE